MAAPKLKLLLLDDSNSKGNGLKSIRELQDQMIDMTDWEQGISDPQLSSGNNGLIIKNNRVYEIDKTYFDLDTNTRVLLAIENTDSYDILPPTT